VPKGEKECVFKRGFNAVCVCVCLMECVCVFDVYHLSLA